MTHKIADLMTYGVNIQSLIPSGDVIQSTLTLKITTTQGIKMSIAVNNSPIQGYAHPEDHKYSTYMYLWINSIIRFCFCDTVEPAFGGHPQDLGKCMSPE